MKRKKAKTKIEIWKIVRLINDEKFEEAKALIPPEARHLPLLVDCVLPAACPCHTSRYNGPLLHFVIGRCQEIFEYLLNGGADIEIKNEYEYTPLHTAVSEGNEKYCRLLLERGAEIETRSGWGSTPLSTAKMHNLLKIKSLLENHRVMRNLSGAISRGLIKESGFSDFLVFGICDPRLFIIVSQFAFQE